MRKQTAKERQRGGLGLDRLHMPQSLALRLSFEMGELIIGKFELVGFFLLCC